MSPWGWQPATLPGIWRHGARWARPLALAAPWIALGMLVLQFRIVSDALVPAKGVLFDLPDAGVGEGEQASLVALAMPVGHDTFLFFDDARYALGDGVSTAALTDHLSDRVAKAERKTLLVLADRRVACGELMKIAALAKEGGVKRLLFANKAEAKSE